MNDSQRAARHKAPGWLAPVLAVLLTLALVWALGVTVFRGALENRGLPEEIRGSGDAQLAQWQYGAQLADLSAQADALSDLADGKVADALDALGESLAQAANLLGQVRYDDQPAPALPVAYSPEAATTLAASVMASGSRAPLDDPKNPQATDLMVRIVFDTSLDARGVITAVHPQTRDQSDPVPLAGSATADGGGDAPQALACLANPSLLSLQAGIPADTEPAHVHAARALDRGYALDYVLQLRAAREGSETAAPIQTRRHQLNEQLDLLRTALQKDCPDVRQVAYQLPESGLEQLPALSKDLETDLINELLLASAGATGEARQVLAATTWNLLTARQDGGEATKLLAGK